ncbi:MAG: GGDEF domain-containing protein, partial [Oscillospiraceae bacterium]|nr:GGDEF domain-containing protein [Oscillospiraceae bacterium]
ADEQHVYDQAVSNVAAVRNGAEFDFEAYTKLTEAYGELLEEHRRSIVISDATTIELYENNVDLTDKMYHDQLTGIYNRRYLEDSLKRISHSLKRYGDVLSVMMIDIDYFKKFNDTYGHSEGDICLKAVAEALNDTLLRPDDFVARYGGEEFSVILPYTDENGSRFIAEKMLKNIRSLKIPHEKSEVADHVTVSIGLTTINAELSQDGEDYLNQADKALYQSKQNGRNQYTFIKYNK